jgi:hypothetical protein
MGELVDLAGGVPGLDDLVVVAVRTSYWRVMLLTTGG